MSWKTKKKNIVGRADQSWSDLLFGTRDSCDGYTNGFAACFVLDLKRSLNDWMGFVCCVLLCFPFSGPVFSKISEIQVDYIIISVVIVVFLNSAYGVIAVSESLAA